MNVYPTLKGIKFPVTFSPIWNNQLQKTVTGRVVATTYQQYPLWKFTLAYDYLSAADFATILGFFNGQGGNLTPFWFDAGPGSDSVTAQGIGTGDGATRTFSLLRSYGGYVEPVVASFGSPTAYDNGTAVSATFNSPANGQVTYAVAPASGHPLTWTGNYYFQCRFSKGSYDIDEFMAQLYEAKRVDLETYW